MSKSQRVFVGLSGGVDSSVAAYRLKKQGFDVVGVFIKVWHPDFLPCDWEEERLDAMRVAAYLNIPFLTCDAEAAYRDQVAEHFIAEYKAGRTPNPDVMCNQHVKFGAFLDFALDHKADYIATGHYARRADSPNGPELHRGVDPDKDQSYFLWTLNNQQLSKTLLPIGDTIKNLIRQEAALTGLPTAIKKDSQGICFLGHVDIPSFLANYTELKPGLVKDLEGNTIGTHVGALVYTIGQRHGLTITKSDASRTPYYVAAKNIENNVIFAATEKPQTPANDLITLERVVLREIITVGSKIEMQTRYRQTPIPIEITVIENNTLSFKLAAATERPAAGQSCVLYQGSLCLGGGIIV